MHSSPPHYLLCVRTGSFLSVINYQYWQACMHSKPSIKHSVGRNWRKLQSICLHPRGSDDTLKTSFRLHVTARTARLLGYVQLSTAMYMTVRYTAPHPKGVCIMAAASASDLEHDQSGQCFVPKQRDHSGNQSSQCQQSPPAFTKPPSVSCKYPSTTGACMQCTVCQNTFVTAKHMLYLYQPSQQ